MARKIRARLIMQPRDQGASRGDGRDPENVDVVGPQGPRDCRRARHVVVGHPLSARCPLRRGPSRRWRGTNVSRQSLRPAASALSPSSRAQGSEPQDVLAGIFLTTCDTSLSFAKLHGGSGVTPASLDGLIQRPGGIDLRYYWYQYRRPLPRRWRVMIAIGLMRNSLPIACFERAVLCTQRL